MQAQEEEYVGPLARYRYDIEHSGFQPDQAQMKAVKALQLVHDDLVERYQAGLRLRGLARISEIRRQRTPAQGLYLWGGVGRGKTYLMDVFLKSCLFVASYAFIFTALCSVFTKSSSYCRAQKIRCIR